MKMVETFLAFKLSDVVFIMLIYAKCQHLLAFTFMSMIHVIHAQLR